jgi:murein DD-endopeptidase MepM/ murein hydrolase activator NlpD
MRLSAFYRILAVNVFLLAWLVQPPGLRADQSCGGQVCVQTQEDAGGVKFTAVNSGAAAVTMQVSVTLTNMKADVNLPYTTVLKPGKASLFSLRVAKKGLRYRYQYTFRYQYGDSGAKPDGHVYSLPFAPGERYAILQGFNSSFSHNGSLAWAMDWDVPEGTPVHAARGGVVIATEDRNTIGAPDRKLFTKANYVLIQHEDGTVGEYYHLKPAGVAVKAGQTVAEGELIGYSGNTGFSTQPHLHFHVSRPVSGTEIETLRIYYRTDGSNAQTLVSGKVYRAVPVPVDIETYRPSGSLPEILLCASLEDGFPVDQKSTFQIGERVVAHFSFAQGAPQRLKVAFRRKGGSVAHEDSILTESNWDYAYISMDPEKIPDALGQWEAVTYVNGSPASVLSFEIRSKAQPSQAPLEP